MTEESDFPQPGKSEFTADEEKAMRKGSDATSPQAGGQMSGMGQYSRPSLPNDTPSRPSLREVGLAQPRAPVEVGLAQPDVKDVGAPSR